MAIERASGVAGSEEARAPPAPPAPPPPPPTRIITLEHGDHLDSTLYRFEKGCQLQFCPGPSLLGRKVFLYTNYVVDDDADGGAAQFVRTQYRALEWRAPGASGASGEGASGEEGAGGVGALIADTDVRCELRLRRAGSFHYYFVYDNAESAGGAGGAGPQGSGWWSVAPTLRAGAGGGHVVPLDGLMCHTVLAKCLGALPRWERVLRVSREAGYNMLHFTPLQELGASNSSYSIANQLRLNPHFGADATFADVESLVTKMRTEWQMLSICDVVLNHTANETPWLETHPEATYNCANCPHLRPAAVLDAVLARLTAAVARGELAARGVPREVTHPDHVEAIRHVLATQLVPEARLHEMYTCDVDELVREFCRLARARVPAAAAAAGEEEELALVPDPQYRRLRATVDMEAALRAYNVRRGEAGEADEEARVRRAGGELRRALERLNAAAAERTRAHLAAAVDNVVAGVRYERLAAEGPRRAEVSARHPLAPRYFTDAGAGGGGGVGAGGGGGSLADAEAALYGAGGARCMAHNGWVMDADPLQDFAARGHVYLRRELIAWGDSVKLRYGARPEDSPFLWAHMRQYVELTARLFDGLRLDNCHSTPLHVAEYMLDCARNVKPDLYVVAELFTNSDHVDNIFVNRLGITSLVREAQSAWDAREQGRLVHRFGGRAVGAFVRPPRRAARPAVAHAMLLDLTHDNPSPVERRCVLDLVPCAALVAMACCATGSTRGYDELVPHHVHVVEEARQYAAWGEAAPAEVGAGAGILAAKRALNDLHLELARDGYSEVYVDQMDDDVVAVTRHEPRHRKSVILVAFTAFSAPEGGGAPRAVRPLRFEGQLEEIVLEIETVREEAAAPFARHAHYINGLRSHSAAVRRAVPLARSRVFAGAAQEGAHTVLRFRPLAPGTVAAVRVAPRPAAAAALRALTGALDALAADERADPWALAGLLAALDLGDLNALLYRCEAEEREAGGGGAYQVPGWGAAPYAGLQGAASLLAAVAAADDLGHALCENLRAGDWLAEYTAARLEREPRLAALGGAARAALAPVRALPRFLVPAYFAAVHGALAGAAARAALARLGGAPALGALGRALALTSVQLAGAVASAPLPPPSPPPPRSLSLSAGLPHFAVGYMRCWGRDTFISLRGMFLLTERYQEARLHLLGFAACLRHGLIPNLLDGGRRARYNCRDAVWWWLQALQHYCTEAPGGAALLRERVQRLAPHGEPAPPAAPLHDLVQEALHVHFQGLVFRERNAGREIDAHMTDKGFTVQIGIDPETGFPFGGNDANCGTWMDKMGSSEKAGTRGKPATPRDGSAVELVGLCYSAVSWLARLHRAGDYPHAGVERRHRDGGRTAWTWPQWAERIRRAFERHYWVPAAPSAADARPDLVHRRAIYKDCHGASQPWADYQLRCNFPIAMAVAPDLFDPHHAWAALDMVETLLVGPLGVKTLDPADWAYRGDYDNSNDGDDPSVAHGFNYHQGPEWVWPLGYYLRARLAFAHAVGRHARTLAAVSGALGPLLAELRASPWRGLPELTGPGGAYCRDSCRSQAWSAALALEVAHALAAARRARPLPAA